MNIISNDCLGAYVYQDQLKIDFQNPFIWCSINIENFVKLIDNYDKIDFKNIECDLQLNDSGICQQGSYTPRIIIDNKVDVNFFHYIQSEKYDSPTKINGYTMCKDILDYTKVSYLRRLEKTNSNPIFVWDVTMCGWYNKKNVDVINTFKTINTEYKIIVYSPNVSDSVDINIITLHKDNKSSEVNVSASNVYKKCLIDL